MFKKSSFWKITSILCCSLVVCLIFSSSTFAKCAGTDTMLINCDEGGDGGIFYIIRVVMEIFFAGVGILSTIGIILAGVKYTTAGDDPAKVADAKTRIINIVLGIVVSGIALVIIELLLPGGFMRNVNVESIEISFDGTTEVGQAAIAHITITPVDANDLTYSIATEDNNIVDVNSKQIKCKKEGKAIITVISANGKTGSGELTCVAKTVFKKPELPRRDTGDYDAGESGDYYDSDKMQTVINAYKNGQIGNQEYEKVKKLAKDRFGIQEDNFIGVMAWARIENYEQNDTGSGERIYMAYLCNSVGINNAIAYEKQGNHSGWLDEMVNGGYNGWGSVYQDARYYGSQGYYQSNLQMVRYALDHLYPNIHHCSGDRPSGGATLVYHGTNAGGQDIYIW